ncbi:amino acid adenylation domain-containing protein [Luteibacter sp. 9135]|uniref:amino acid adenylation domain-containing protein n=1 Tax=Luteibacter sp. 9135 TaxID=1500893 RepID=UPI00068F0F95|nr:amino acid adenylation domain-containing protein [Luteibacter sp. 9135]
MESTAAISKLKEAAHADWPSAMRKRNGWHIHAVACRLVAATDEEAIGAMLLALDEQLSGMGWTGSGAALHVATVAAPSASEVARRQRTREMSRLLPYGTGQILRAMVLRYVDGQRDLILVGDRAVLDQDALQRIARYCLSRGEAPLPIVLRHLPRPSAADIDAFVGADVSPTFEWDGRGTRQAGQSVVEIDAGADMAPECWLAALGSALSRFHGKPSPAVAILREEASHGSELALGATGFRLASLLSTGDASVSHVLDHSRAQLTNAMRYTESLLGALNERYERPLDVAVGVIFPHDIDGIVDMDYMPCSSAMFPITLVVGNRGSGRLACHFDGAMYSAPSIQWLLRCVAHACRQLQGSEAARLADVELLPPEVREEVVALGRSGGGRVPDADRIESAFGLVSARQPDAIAISFDDEELMYAELDLRSSLVAAALAARGVTSGSFVGICLERSAAVIVAMLAILKCGAIYVPMDPAYPRERLEYTASDAGLALTITDDGTFPEVAGMAVTTIEELAREADGCRPWQAVGGADGDAAYMIYTSGSTGRPKGVLIPHRNVIALIDATREGLELSPRDTWTLFHSSAFDFSVWEIWGCLLTGGHLVVVPHWVSRDPEQFRELIGRKSVSVLNQTPSAFYQLIEVDRRAPVSDSLRVVIFGGEPLDARALLPWFDRHPESRCRLVNMFGITETTVHVTWQEVRRREALSASRSVGTPIPGWHLYVMDEQQRLLPPGVAGEVYVGGAGVALRYHGRDDLTQARFMPDPFQKGIMYRTGDRGCMLANGTLEHFGRLDNQIKLRGFRIELDEIRRVLLGHDAVRAAAVLFNQPNPADPASARIDAYLVAEGATGEDIRAHVARFLPEHMLPSTFTFVPAMPLTTNGKLDAKRLPSPDLSAPVPPTAADSAVQPLSAMEETMHAIWQDVLGREIGADENFFDLGGNSLLAVRIAAAMRKQGLPPLPMRDLYTHQTIRKLVAALA